MPLRFTHRREEEVPRPSALRKINPDLLAIKEEMAKLAAGMVLEIETDSERTVRGTKMLVTRAAKELGSSWQHWNVGAKVFARPALGDRRSD